jgi:cytochrome P450
MTERSEQQLEYPMVRTCPFTAPPGYAELRERSRISQVRLPTGRLAWAITDRDDIKSMMLDSRLSSNLRHPGFPVLADHMVPPDDFDTSLIGMDDPEHVAARRAVIADFTVRAVGRLRPRIQEIVDERIDLLLAGPRPVDLVESFAFPVPLMVICELLGVPFDDRAAFQDWVFTFLSGSSSPEDGGRALKSLMQYMHELVTAKERDPDDGLLGRQVRRRGEPGVADHDGLVGLGIMLLMAGHETTANVISLGVLTFLEHQEQFRKILDDPAKIPGAVEELVRFYTIAEIGAARVAVEDIEVGGVTIKAGEGVLNLITAANRDPKYFDEPHEFNIERPADHIAFGFGKHQCLGQNLARVELAIVFETLFRRIPDLRLAVPFEELRFNTDAVNYGVHELPLTW